MPKRKRVSSYSRSRKRRRVTRTRGYYKRFRRRKVLRKFTWPYKSTTGIFRGLSDMSSGVRVKRTLVGLLRISNISAGTYPIVIRGYEAPRLSIIPNISNHISIYQWYKITGFKITFIPLANCQGTYQDVGHPAIAMVPWRLSETIPTSFENVIRTQGSSVSVGAVYKRYFKCTVLEAGWQSANSFRIRNPGWYRTTDIEVPHYGCRYVLENRAPTTTALEYATPILTFITVYLRFKKQYQ